MLVHASCTGAVPVAIARSTKRCCSLIEYGPVMSLRQLDAKRDAHFADHAETM